MSNTNELSGGNELNLILSKRFDISNAPAPFMASEIFPNVVLENDRPEWKYLAQERLACGHASDGAVAGQYSHAWLTNPAGSDVIAVVRAMIQNVIGATSQINLQYTQAAYVKDLTLAGRLRDSRWGWASSGAGTVGTICLPGITTSVARIGQTMIQVNLANNDTYEIPDIVLKPGATILINPQLVNNAAYGQFFWRERRAQPGELI